MSNRATASWVQSAYPGQGQAGSGTQEAAQQNWEAYYNYAQQLQANGYTAQAETYFRQAQLLYEQAEAEKKRQRTASYQSYAYPSSDNARVTANVATIYPVNVPMLEVDDDFQARRSSRSAWKIFKIWSITLSVTALLVLVGGFIGLFYVYLQQVELGRSGPASSGSVFDKVQDVTVKPTLYTLKPSYDKIIRVALAAQPLLYELHMRPTPPEEYYSVSSKPPTTVAVKEAGMLPSVDLGNAAENNAEATPEGESENPAASTASEDNAPSEGAADAASKDNAAEEKTAVESAAAKEDDGQNEDDDASSSAQSGRSRRHRSHRSSASEQADVGSSNVQEVGGWVATPVGDNEKSSGAVKAIPSAPSFQENPPTNPNSKTKELDDLLAPKPKAPARQEKASFENPAWAVQQSLSRADVQQGMMQVAPAVKRCGQGTSGTVSVTVKIGRNGRVMSAVAAGVYAGTAIGACAERAVRQATFPTSQQSLTVKYPFTL